MQRINYHKLQGKSKEKRKSKKILIKKIRHTMLKKVPL